MNARNLPFFYLPTTLLFFCMPLFSQVELKVQWMEENKWGVFARPDGFVFNDTVIVGTAQVTLVMPSGYQTTEYTSVNGIWSSGPGLDIVDGPVENPAARYISVALIHWNSVVDYFPESDEILLFTFKGNGDCPDFIHLIDSENDPFMDPNSHGTNPGNDFSVIDVTAFPMGFYFYEGNYALHAWDCHDNDGDGFLNAFEDTNGNGIYDPGIDASDLNSPNFDSPDDPAYKEAEYESFIVKKNIQSDTHKKNSNTPSVTSPYSFYSKNEQAFTLSPNPANDFLYIQMGRGNDIENAQLQLVNLQGAVLKIFEINPTGRQSISISDLPSGVYFLSAKTADGQVDRQRFIKQ